MAEKELLWVGSSRDDIRALPKSARAEAGHQLHLVQLGAEPADWKPMSIIGTGVNELRIRTNGTYRVIYVAKFAEAIYVLHVFEKKSQKTSKADIELAKTRLGDVKAHRKGK